MFYSMWPFVNHKVKITYTDDFKFIDGEAHDISVLVPFWMGFGDNRIFSSVQKLIHEELFLI